MIKVDIFPDLKFAIDPDIMKNEGMHRLHKMQENEYAVFYTVPTFYGTVVYPRYDDSLISLRPLDISPRAYVIFRGSPNNLGIENHDLFGVIDVFSRLNDNIDHDFFMKTEDHMIPDLGDESVYQVFDHFNCERVFNDRVATFANRSTALKFFVAILKNHKEFRECERRIAAAQDAFFELFYRHAPELIV